MAKSKSGGSRSRLRGRLANDVYSIGVDGKGKKQQVVRSLAESVANPRTLAQNKQRMILTSVALLSKALSPIIDHSFDGVPAGQPSISEFTRRAIAAYRDDAQLTSPNFGYSAFGGVVAPNPSVMISHGRAKFGVNWYAGQFDQYGKLWHGVGVGLNFGYYGEGQYPELPASDVIDKLFGGSVDNFITIVGVAVDNVTSPTKSIPIIIRIQPKSLADVEQWIQSSDSTLQHFNIESNVKYDQMVLQVASGQYTTETRGFGCEIGVIINGYVGIASALILSKKTASGWQHSTSFLDATQWDEAEMPTPSRGDSVFPHPVLPFADALATYPLGEEKFLNGGDL